MMFKDPVNQIDITLKGWPGISGGSNRHAACRAATMTPFGKYRYMAGVAPAQKDPAKILGAHRSMHMRW
jgi:hypothetical protein